MSKRRRGWEDYEGGLEEPSQCDNCYKIVELQSLYQKWGSRRLICKNCKEEEKENETSTRIIS